MAIAIRWKQPIPVANQAHVLDRGLPTDRQVQNKIAQDMLTWLGPALEKLMDDVMMVLKQDIVAGRITPPPIGQKAAKSELEKDEWWEKATTPWMADCENWLTTSLAAAAEYQAKRFNFYVDMRLMNRAAHVYTQITWWPELIKLDGDQSVINETRLKVWSSVLKWQRGELGDHGLPDLTNRLAQWFDPARAKRIAATEATRVYAEGNRMAWMGAANPSDTDVAFGITAMRWQTAADALVCPICGPLNSKQVLLNQGFPGFAGEVPPAHVNCRCWITPIKNYNSAFRPAGTRAPSMNQIEDMRKATMPERFQRLLEIAARGTEPAKTLEELAERMKDVRGWTPEWRKAFLRSFEGAPQDAVDFMARRQQYSGAVPLDVAAAERYGISHFQPDGEYIAMAEVYTSGRGSAGFVMRHELGHAYDWQLGGSIGYYSSSNQKFYEAWTKYSGPARGEGAPGAVEAIITPLKKYSQNSAINDIYSALGVEWAYGHSAEYWAQGGARSRGTQIFANLFSLRSQKSSAMYRSLGRAMPDLIKAFEEALKL